MEVLFAKYLAADGSTVVAKPSLIQTPSLLLQHVVLFQPQQMLLSGHSVTLTSVSLYDIPSSASRDRLAANAASNCLKQPTRAYLLCPCKQIFK